MIEGGTGTGESPGNLGPVERAGQGWRALDLEAKRACEEAPEALQKLSLQEKLLLKDKFYWIPLGW